MVVQYMIRDLQREDKVFCRTGNHWVLKDIEMIKSSRNPTGYNTLCKSCGKEERQRANSRFNRKMRAWLNSLKDKPCYKCGLSWPPCVMDWHHRDPTTKLFNMASAHRIKDKTKILAEAAKCDLYCSNCHRILTHVEETV